MGPAEANAATLQNDKNTQFTRLQDIPPEIIIQIFTWLPGRAVLKKNKYGRLSRTINQCLMTTQFAVLNMQRTAVASAMFGQLKHVRNVFGSIEMSLLPESITCLTAVEKIELRSCKLIGNLPNGIVGVLQNLTHLDLSANALMGLLPSSLILLAALRILLLTKNQLSREFHILPNLNALKELCIASS
ncbi:hypothetical protein HDU78_006331 [Chytriomyces hyalinus]|nr:hypothetical protein HDU78_006331 [Chytriomyces hyalinus]